MASITQKPTRSAYVAPRSLPWAWVSGIISSLITYSMVPPANASAKGRIAAERLTAKKPSNVPSTSTIPVAAAIRKVRRGFIQQKYQVLVDALFEGKQHQYIETEVKFEDGRTGRIAADIAIREAATHAPVARAA